MSSVIATLARLGRRFALQIVLSFLIVYPGYLPSTGYEPLFCKYRQVDAAA